MTLPALALAAAQAWPPDLHSTLSPAMLALTRGQTQIALLLAFVLTAGGLVYYWFFDTYHFATVDPGVLYRDGNRNMRQFELALAKSQATVVVLLVDEKELGKSPFRDELEYLSRTKITPVGIPVRLGGFPSTQDVQKFLGIAERAKQSGENRVLVHCAQGIRRTGMMVAAYQLSILGWSKDKAKDELLSFGHSERTVNDIKKFIDVYDPATRTVTQDLGTGSE